MDAKEVTGMMERTLMIVTSLVTFNLCFNFNVMLVTLLAEHFKNYAIKVCRMEEHQHQLAHQCSPNIIGIWEWGICGLMGGAFMGIMT